MEFQLPSLGLLLAFLLFLLVLVSKLRHRERGLDLKYPLPPGPWKLPVIGSAHHMVGGHPHRVLRDLSKRYGDVMELKVGEIDLVVISSPEAAAEVMSTNDLNFASRPELAINKISNSFGGKVGMALAPYGDHWRQLRKMCSLGLLSSKRVKSLSWLREDEISKLVGNISCPCPPINLSEKFLAVSNTVVYRAVLDKDGRHQERLSSALVDMIKSSTMFGFVELYPSLEQLAAITGVKDRLVGKLGKVEAILDEIISDHQESSSNNKTRNVEDETFLDVLLGILEQGDLEVPLNINNVKAVILELVTGGTDATAGVMEWTMAELMRNPRVMEKAQEEVRRVLRGKEKMQVRECDLEGLMYLKMVIKEALRLRAPVPLLVPRICNETCQVSGYSIVAGRKIVVNAWALGRDPRYWDDAESFRPERFSESIIDGGGGGGVHEFKGGSSFQFVPFGAGRRMCPGIGFGLALVELVLAQLLLHFDWELPEGMLPQDLDMTEAFATTVYLKSDLLLLARPRPHA